MHRSKLALTFSGYTGLVNAGSKDSEEVSMRQNGSKPHSGLPNDLSYLQINA